MPFEISFQKNKKYEKNKPFDAQNAKQLILRFECILFLNFTAIR
jgi:hypothetical protein